MPSGGRAECRARELQVPPRLGDHVVRRKHAHHGIRDRASGGCAPPDQWRARCCAAPVRPESGAAESPGSCRTISSRRCSLVRTQMPFRRNQRRQAVHGGLDQRALAENRQHLFGVRAAAARPESRAAAAGQDQAVIMFWHGLLDGIAANQAERPAPARLGEEVLGQID